MKTGMPEALLSHLQGEVTTTAICWRIHLKDGSVILGTEHDEDILITETHCHDVAGTIFEDLTGLYRAGAGIRMSDVRVSSDMSVDNSEAEGSVDDAMAIPDLTVERIESGLADGAPVIAFKVNWQRPDDGQDVTNFGMLGEFEWDSSGRYRTEIRGVGQRLMQNIVQTFSERCQVVEFGDQRCGFDLAAATRLAVVTAVTNRRQFRAQITSGDAPPTETYFDGARLTFTSGDNENFFREVKRAVETAGEFDITLWDEMPADIEVGDTLTLPPGCDRTPEACKLHGRYTTGWRGYGVFMPGMMALMKGPT